MDTNLNNMFTEGVQEGSAESAMNKENGNGISRTGNSPLIVQENGVKRSATIGKLVAALCKAQLEFEPVVKANINPQFKSKYADLATIIQATMPALAKNGLAIIQIPSVVGRELTMTTMLVHSSDEWISNDLTMPATMRNELTAQTIGSACTYSRRYALQSILGIAADVDDDANSASGIGKDAVDREVERQKKGKAFKDEPKATPDTLFYTMPANHNGFFAEFINIKSYGSALNEVAAEGLRQIFKPYISKITKDETVLVSTSKLPELLEKLAGDGGITVQELKAARS